MGVQKGLAAIKADQDRIARAKEERENRDYVKATWFVLKKDKDARKIRFLQELDEESPHYSERNGVGFIAIEHSNPEDFKRKALCTMDDEGKCLGCEMRAKTRDSKWGQKRRLYINVLVLDDPENDEPYVAVLSQGTSGKSITPTLLEYAYDTNSITNRTWKIKRVGSGFNDTSYTIMAFDPDSAPFDVEQYELFDLDKIVRNVPYEEQARHYGLEATADEEAERELVGAGATSAQVDW